MASPTPTENPLRESRARQTVASPTAAQVDPATFAEQHGGEDGGEHDVRARDEPRHGGGGRRESLSLEDLGQAVEAAESGADEDLTTGQGTHRSPEHDEHDDGREAEAHREEVDGRDGL